MRPKVFVVACGAIMLLVLGVCLYLTAVLAPAAKQKPTPQKQEQVTIDLFPNEDGSLSVGLGGDVRATQTIPITISAIGPGQNDGRRHVIVERTDTSLRIVIRSDEYVRLHGVSLQPTYTDAERRAFTDTQGNCWTLLFKDDDAPTDNKPLKGSLTAWEKGPHNEGRLQFDEVVDWDRGIFRKWECLTSYNPPSKKKD